LTKPEKFSNARLGHSREFAGIDERWREPVKVVFRKRAE